VTPENGRCGNNKKCSCWLPAIAGTPGRAGAQPRRDAHRAQGGLSPWLAVSRRPARPACPAAPGPGAGEMTAAPRWSRAGVRGELADVTGRLLRGRLAVGRLASDGVAGVAGTGGRQLTALGSPGRAVPRAPRPRGSGPAWIGAPAPRPGRPGRGRIRRLPAARSPRAGAWPELPRYRERGRARPPRPAAGSFISCGAFAGPGRARAHARLLGNREAVHRGRVACTVVLIQYPRSRNSVQGHGAEDPGSVR
jgi:hypothetical protein